MPFFLNPVEVYGLDCSNCAVELITLVENFVQWKHSNHVMYFDQLSQTVCAVCAVDPIKLVLNFFHPNHLSLIDQLN